MNAVVVSSPILIHRAQHDTKRPYLKVSHAVIQDDRLSVTALGMLVYLLSNKDTWRIDPSHLAKRLRLNVATVRKLLHELSDYGYVKLRERQYDAQGQIVWTDYHVYESPETAGKSGSSSASRHTKQLAPLHKKAASHKNTIDGKTTHGKATPIIRNNSNKKEKDSPAEKSPSRASAVLSPYGDAHAGIASRIENEQQRPEPEETTVVKAQDSLRFANLHDQEKSLPVSSADEAPVPRATRPADQRLHAVLPVIDVPRPAPKSASQATTHSHKPGATRPAAPVGSPTQPAASPINSNAMQAVVTYAFKIGQGGYAAKMGQFLAAKLPPRHKDMWSQHQPDKPASPQEIMALLSWYRQNAAYASSCTERGGKLPSTPAILRDRLDEFRDSEGYASAMQAAQPLLDRLLRGESLTAPVTPASAKPANAIGSVESVGAYKLYDRHQDPQYKKEPDPRAAELIDQLFKFGGAQ